MEVIFIHYSSVFGGQFTWISEDGRPERKNKAVLSNSSDVVYEGTKRGNTLTSEQSADLGFI